MARPKKDSAEKLGKPISFRPTVVEEEIVLKKIAASGLTKSAFFRECVLTNRTQIIARPKTSHDKSRLLYLFNKTSNNINQLAHKTNLAHKEGTVSSELYKKLLLELHSLSHLMKAVIKDVD
jgi:hypothetical protein